MLGKLVKTKTQLIIRESGKDYMLRSVQVVTIENGKACQILEILMETRENV